MMKLQKVCREDTKNKIKISGDNMIEIIEKRACQHPYGI